MLISLTLTIKDIDNEVVEFQLASPENVLLDQPIIWKRKDQEPFGNAYDLVIKTEKENTGWKIEILKKGCNILESNEAIIEQCANVLLESSIKAQTDNADGVDYENDALAESKVEIDQKPYDPKLIRVDTKAFSIHQIYEMMTIYGELDLSPDFEREFVWQDITRKSRLIESLLLRIPIPAFYLAQDEEGRFKVVDGVQRLTVIRDFISNKFRLKNLEYLKDCEGKWFKNPNRPERDNLPSIYVRRIEQTQLYCNVIDPQTPEKVKYDIFRRINTGGKTLNAQEIRNCLETTETRKYINRLATTDEFLTATRHSISSTRMADKEMILRFIAFYLLDRQMCGQKPYRGDMDAYLDSTVGLINKFQPRDYLIVEDAFKNAMRNAKILFGERAFRKTSYINKALFLSWSRVLCNIHTEKILNCGIGPILQKRLENEIKNNADYSKALSMATNDVKHVELSYKTAERLLYEVMRCE